LYVGAPSSYGVFITYATCLAALASDFPLGTYHGFNPFNFYSSFDVRLKAAMLILLIQQLTTSQLRQRIDSDVQQRQFVRSSTGGDTTITVSDINWCHDVTGCACNNQQVT